MHRLDAVLLSIVDNLAFSKHIIVRSAALTPLIISAPLFGLGLAPRAVEDLWSRAICSEISNFGPTSVKFLQWASTRKDLFPPSVCQHLARYHDKVPLEAFPFVCAQFTAAIEQFHRIGYIQPWPCGSGSVAQVYASLLPVQNTSEPNVFKEGVVKLLRHKVEQRVRKDLSILYSAAALMEKCSGAYGEWLPLRASVQQFGNLVLPQCDLLREAMAMQKFHSNFNSRASRRLLSRFGGVLVVPRVEQALSTSEALFEEREKGLHFEKWIKESAEMRKAARARRFATHTPWGSKVVSFLGLRRFFGDEEVLERRLANMGVNMFLQMLINDNFVHSDLHPGNILIRWRVPESSKSPRWKPWRGFLDRRRAASIELVLLDGGLTTSLGPRDRTNFIDLFRAVAFGEGYKAGELLLNRARKHQCKDEHGFCCAVASLVARYVGPQISISDLNRGLLKRFTIENLRMGEVLQDIMRCSLNYRVELDPAFVGVMLATVVLEGVGRTLDPTIDLLAAARPFLSSILLSQSANHTS